MAAIRLAVAIASRGAPPQAPLDEGAVAEDGALVLTRGLVRRKRFRVSASLTGDAAAPNGSLAARGGSSMLAEDLRTVLATFTAARYGRTAAAPAALDRALGDAIDLVRRLRGTRAWRSRLSDAVAEAAEAVRAHAPGR
jgi:hypothetical protein